jgi:hypothetical protein
MLPSFSTKQYFSIHVTALDFSALQGLSLNIFIKKIGIANDYIHKSISTI